MLMNIYSIPPLICAVISAILGGFIYSRHRKSPQNITFSLLCLTTFWWQFSWFILFNIKEDAIASVLVRIGYSGIIFIPIAFFHFTLEFNETKKRKEIALFSYLIGLAFFFSLWFSNYFINGYYKNYFWGFYPKANFLHPLYLIFLAILVIYCAWLYLISINNKNLSGIKRYQSRYLFIALIIYALASIDFIVNYGIQFYPFGFIFVIGSLGIIAYAIARYRLLDINVVLTRAGIFGIVYTFVLGVPFWIGSKTNSWLVPTSVAVLLASLGPFLYNYLRRQAEDRLLAEEKRGHQLLTSASKGMTRIRDLKKLLHLIVHITTKILKVNNAAIFLLDNERKIYNLKAIRLKSTFSYLEEIDSNDVLIQRLVEKDEPLIFEEIKMQAQTDKGDSFLEIQHQMKELRASLIAPSTAGNRLLGFLILGEKKSGRMYTQDDVALLTTLANQAALAIENALFYQEDAERKALLYQSAILSDLGVMADSMGHQIKNHIQKMMADAGVQSAFVEEYLNKDFTPQQLKDFLVKIKSTLDKIELQGKKGGELIESIRKFSHLPSQDFKEINIKDVLDLANEILALKVRFDEIDYLIDIPATLPPIYGHPILSEAFVNFIDNGFYATKEIEEVLTLEAKRQGKEPVAFRGRIEFRARQIDPNHIQIKITDNGIGIKKENLKHLFFPFYTTKATSAKGTGLGLYVVKNIINNHKGKIEVESEYLKGTTFTITLPIRQ